jgi:hypothetical protein
MSRPVFRVTTPLRIHSHLSRPGNGPDTDEGESALHQALERKPPQAAPERPSFNANADFHCTSVLFPWSKWRVSSAIKSKLPVALHQLLMPTPVSNHKRYRYSRQLRNTFLTSAETSVLPISSISLDLNYSRTTSNATAHALLQSYSVPLSFLNVLHFSGLIQFC